MTRHEKKDAMEIASARQAIAGLDAAYVQRTAEAIDALQGLDGPPHATALLAHLYEVLSLLESLRDEKVPNAALIEAMEEARTLKGRYSADELFRALEAGKE